MMLDHIRLFCLPQWLRSQFTREQNASFSCEKRKPIRLSFLLPVAFLCFCCFLQLKTGEIFLRTVASWKKASRTVSEFWTSAETPKKCQLVAMVITSESDYQNGNLDTWFATLPLFQSNKVCCVSIRRSMTTASYFKASPITCDVMFLPMIRDDEYLTISEKLRLGFAHITKYYDFEWLLKADADSFVCFSKLLNLIQNFDPLGVTQVGFPESRNIILDSPHHKWYDSSMTDIVHNSRQDVIPGITKYHPYMQGAGYLLSRGALNTIQPILPSLRYSPMEDAMVGSWMLALNAHRAVLNIDLPGRTKDCLLLSNMTISHHKSRARDLTACREYNRKCLEMSNVYEVDVTDVSFIIPVRMDEHKNMFMELYESIRTMFPRNEILFGDMSRSDNFLSRFLGGTKDEYLVGRSFPEIDAASVQNQLVQLATSTYICVIQDVQRLSWETLIGKMLKRLQSGEADVVGGFLKFNPNLPLSEKGLAANGYNYSLNRVPGMITKEVQPTKNISELGEVCVPANGTSGFMVAPRDFLLRHRWVNLGPFTDDAFYLSLNEAHARIMVCNSGVRHGYHFPLMHRISSQDEVKQYGPEICRVLSLPKYRAFGMVGINSTIDCRKKTYKRWKGDIGLRW